ncbi:MAG: calcium/sodium antiporter [Gammaproteobacteria bacterium]
MILAFFQIIAGLGLLVYGADKFVNGASGLARRLGVPPIIIGMSVVGVATSIPEVLVGSVAALNGKTHIAIGNALGSNIANMGLVLGGTAVIMPMVARSDTLLREYKVMCIAMLAALLILLDLDLSRTDGIILLLALAVVSAWIFHVARTSPGTDPLAREYEKEFRAETTVARSLLILVFGLGLLLAGAEILVRGAVFVAEFFGISDLVIGLTVIAVGTSLPELAASIMSVLKDEADIAIGNVIGSNIFNMLMVLGVPPLIHPDSFGFEVLWRDFSVMVILTVLMGIMVFLRGHGRFDRGEGALLLSGFLAYQSWLFFAATG